MDYFLVGYKENQPCPVCGETIVSIKRAAQLLLYVRPVKSYKMKPPLSEVGPCVRDYP